MKKSYAVVALLLTLGIGFFAGRLSGPGNSTAATGAGAADERAANGRSRASDRPPGERQSGQPLRLRDEIRKASPEALSALVYRALEISDPLQRRQALLEIFARMDAGNFEAMIRESERSSLETSRNNYDEWAVMLVRAGQVGGQAAMELWSGDLKKNWDQLSKTMQGWASTDPEAALRWIEKQDLPPTSRANFMGSLIAGAIARDGTKALALLASLPEADRMTSIQQTTHHLTQNAGKEGLIEWLQSVSTAEPGSPYAKKVTDSVFDKIVWAGANQYNIPTVVADLEKFSSVIPMDEGRIARAIAQVRSRDPIQGLVMLDQLSRSSVLANQSPTPTLYSQSIEPAVHLDRAGVAKWLAENPASPIHAKVTEAFNRPPKPAAGQAEVPSR